MKKDFISSFYLKIIALITMTIDHFGRIGYLDYLNNSSTWFNETIFNICTIIGRISFPIFAFFIVEGINHSKNKKLYLLRLFLLAICSDLLMYIVSQEYIGNPVTTLFFGALTIALLEEDKILLKILSIIPISTILLISFEIIPILATYDLYGLCLILLFYFSLKLSPFISLIISNHFQIEKEFFKNEYNFIIRKLTTIFFLFSFNILILFINPTYNYANIFIDDPIKQLYSTLAGIFILIYNGKQGYNKKWFKYGSYLYFPLHIAIIYLLFYLI